MSMLTLSTPRVRRVRSLPLAVVTAAGLLAWGCGSNDGTEPDGDDVAFEDASAPQSDATSPRDAGGSLSGGSSSGGASSSSGGSSGQPSGDAGFDAGDEDAAADAGPSADAAADSGDAPGALPGLSCSGALTDQGLVALYSNHPTTGTPSYLIGGSNQARRLGAYTSAVYTRHCDSIAGCTAWTAAEQPTYERFWSINAAVRSGSVYAWSYGDGTRIGLVSSTVGDECLGWTQGLGTIQRDGTAATVTLDAEVEDNCVAGADPVYYFNQIDLHDPTGVVTDHCLKLSYSKQVDRIDTGPGAYLYEEYAVVYDATF